jgi:hypothetical protein
VSDYPPPEKQTMIRNLNGDARLSVVVGLIPILGLIYILRLVQWYLWRSRWPALSTSSDSLAVDFRGAKHRLWFAVLLWPMVILAGALFILLAPK